MPSLKKHKILKFKYLFSTKCHSCGAIMDVMGGEREKGIYLRNIELPCFKCKKVGSFDLSIDTINATIKKHESPQRNKTIK